MIFVGTGCGIPSDLGASPCIIMVGKGRMVLFDSGPGSLRRITAIGFKANDIDHIFFTHLHVDHVGDLPSILFAFKYPLDPRKKRLLLFGPKGLKEFYENLLRLYGEQILSSNYHLEIKEMEGGVVELGGWCVRSDPLSHAYGSIGYRIEEDGKVVVYSGDTGFCDEIVQLVNGADLAILECSFPDGMEVVGHLTPSLAGRVAKEGGCKRVVLTHLYPVCKDKEVVKGCKALYDGEVILAEDGMGLEV